MSRLRLMRRSTLGLPCLLVAALVLFARLAAPAMAMSDAIGDPLSQTAICHTAAPGEAPTPRSDDHHECLLCPACHLVSHAVLPTPLPPVVPLPTVWAIGTAAPLPPATAPPGQVRTAAQPTGPPRFSA